LVTSTGFKPSPQEIPFMKPNRDLFKNENSNSKITNINESIDGNHTINDINKKQSQKNLKKHSVSFENKVRKFTQLELINSCFSIISNFSFLKNIDQYLKQLNFEQLLYIKTEIDKLYNSKSVRLLIN
jgi:hypothetical protein